MDDQLLLQLYHRLFDPGNEQLAPGCVYSDSAVAMIYFLGVVRGRSPRWAARAANWPLWMRRCVPRPSYSQLRRRLNTASVLGLIRRLDDACRAALPRSAEKACDGKPLPVGGYSKDPDATEGKLPGGGWGRGYKLHVILDAACGAVDAFAVTALAAPGEPTVAARLVAAHPGAVRGAVMRGDSAFDSNPLYAAVADAGGRLVASRKKPGTGLGHHRHHPDRLRAIEELERTQGGLAAHRRRRARVEQGLAHLTNLPCGLSPLPNFVRRLPRVELWVLAKIALYHLHLMLRARHALAA
jgi:hypothetical protein